MKTKLKLFVTASGVVAALAASILLLASGDASQVRVSEASVAAPSEPAPPRASAMSVALEPSPATAASARRERAAGRDSDRTASAREETARSGKGEAPERRARDEAPLSVMAALEALRAANADESRSTDEAMFALRAALEGASSGEVAALLASVRTTEDPALLGTIGAALDPHGLERAEVRAALGEIAQRDASVARREFAVTALGMAAPDDGLVALLVGAARGDASPDVRQSAASALSQAMDRDLSRGAAIDAELVRLATSDQDASVRCSALWSLKMHEADAATVERLTTVFQRETELAPRMAAAEALGEVSPENRTRAVSALAAAIGDDRDANLRKAELTAIVRAGRTQAIPTLEAIGRAQPDLAQDVQDWLVELRKGEVDMENLLAAKERAEASRRASAPSPAAPRRGE